MSDEPTDTTTEPLWMTTRPRVGGVVVRWEDLTPAEQHAQQAPGYQQCERLSVCKHAGVGRGPEGLCGPSVVKVDRRALGAGSWNAAGEQDVRGAGAMAQAHRAVRVADQLDVDARRKGQPWPLARAARCRAMLAPDGHFEELFREAATLHAQTPDVFELGVTRLAFGGRLRRHRQRTRAREELRRALDMYGC